jgi:hypothetical protein
VQVKGFEVVSVRVLEAIAVKGIEEESTVWFLKVVNGNVRVLSRRVAQESVVLMLVQNWQAVKVTVLSRRRAQE